jgi:hypothetical protein
VSGVPVTTFHDWARKLRISLLPRLPTRYTEETPDAVVRLKKHPAWIAIIDQIAEEHEAALFAKLSTHAAPGAEADALARAWRASKGLALKQRSDQLRAWSSDKPAEKDKPAERSELSAALRYGIDRETKALNERASVATIDDVTRFGSAHQFEAYLGLVPGERSSGEVRRIGPITKAGNARARWLLVEAAWRILRSKEPAGAPLRAWARPIAARRGSRIAVVAVARRLAGILYAMWRDGAPYDPDKIRRPAGCGSPRAEDTEPLSSSVTESGAASASQLMAAGRGRRLVGAVRSFVPPPCAEADAPHR